MNSILGVVAAVLAATAFGAIWSLVALATGTRAPWMAVLVAVLICSLLRFNGHPPSFARSAGAVLLSALAVLHANYLMAAGFIAAQMSMGFVDLLWRMGFEMALAVSRAHAEPFELAYYAIALALAGWLGLRTPGEILAKTPRRRS